MRTLAALVVVGWLAGRAHAGPTARVGLTYGLEDPQRDGLELGPLLALGDRFGPVVAEAEWADLSFFDPQMGHVQRLGVTLRADVASWPARYHHRRWTSNFLYAEAGAAERFGHWQRDAYTISPIQSPQPEAHLGIGLEMDNGYLPRRDGWQLGLRFAVSQADAVPMSTCRGDCPVTVGGGGTQLAILVEWMFLFGY